VVVVDRGLESRRATRSVRQGGCNAEHVLRPQSCGVPTNDKVGVPGTVAWFRTS
jgi:hypothetical protein